MQLVNVHNSCGPRELDYRFEGNILRTSRKLAVARIIFIDLRKDEIRKSLGKLNVPVGVAFGVLTVSHGEGLKYSAKFFMSTACSDPGLS